MFIVRADADNEGAMLTLIMMVKYQSIAVEPLDQRSAAGPVRHITTVVNADIPSLVVVL